ncbi:DUF1048 domain-containing protein [Parasporobacterium paucivorans]|nr:DUF1048 domain-containing protein [Parasporobacterium paucivorans]
MDDKKEYREQMERAEALPEEYRAVFNKIHRHIWSFAGGDGSGMLETQKELLELFEESAANGRNVLEVTGEDVVGFSDEFIRNTEKWTDKYRKNLNRDIMNKFRKEL